MHPTDNNVLWKRYINKKSPRRASLGKQGLQTLKDSSILSLKNFFLALAPLRVVKQSISSSISLSLAMINAEIVAGLLVSLVNFARAQTFCIYKLT